jgi:carbamoyltransferase
VVILGINDGHHAGAALVIDGVLVSAISEERLTRRKCEYGYPELAIAECLRLGGIGTKDIDHVAVSTVSLPPKYFMTKRNTTFSIADYWREQTDYWYPRIYENREVKFVEVFSDKVESIDFPYDRSLIADEDDGIGMRKARHKHIAQALGISPGRISFEDHQTCHANYGYLCHPGRGKPLLIVTADGFGDGANGSLWIAQPGQPLKALARTGKCNIGRLYRYMTLLLGMKPNEHEYKVMGLAPYANETVAKAPYAVFKETLGVGGLDFSYDIQPKDHFFYFKDRLGACRFDGISHALQRFTEELLVEWIVNAVRHTGISDVAFSGGVALNVKANKLIAELDEVDSLFVAPGVNDECMPVGAAFTALVKLAADSGRGLDELQPFRSAYMGNRATGAEIEKALRSENLPAGCSVQKADVKQQAAVLASDGIMARFDGGMEFGPRSLGNRAILADPRNHETVRRINKAIKLRDFWMPFCPSILDRRAADYLVNPKGIDGRYMTVAFDSTESGRRDLPAALHPYDRTARPQIVTHGDNPGFFDLVQAFERETGVGCLLNTSFNIHGEPMVATPEDALNTFSRSGLRHLQIGNWLVTKAEND